MAVGRQAKLILSLVDRVSGPAKAITTALRTVNGVVKTTAAAAVAPARVVGRSAREFRRRSNDMTMASAAVSFGLVKASRAIYEMEDTVNEIVGRRFGKGDTFDLANGIQMNKEAFRSAVKELVLEIDKDSPRNAGEIAKAYNQLVQAGLTHEQVEAVLPISVKFAIAGNYDTEEAADKLTNVMTSMQMPMATYEQAVESARRASDVIAYAANRTNSSVQQMTESFKFAAPIATSLGLDVERLAAAFVIQARSGIKASESGVAMRAMLVRLVRPTKAAVEVLARYGMDLNDYMENAQAVTTSDITGALGLSGVDASGAADEITRILTSSLKTNEKVQRVTEAIVKKIGDTSTMSRETIANVLREVMYGRGETLDFERLIADMEALNIPAGEFYRIFDVRQGARTRTLFTDDLSQWVEDIRKFNEGFTEALSAERMHGFVGAVKRMESAIIRGVITIADSGVLDTVTEALKSFTASLDGLAKVNPEILKMGTYAAIAIAALAPLGFALAGLGTVFSLLLNPITYVVAGLGYLAYLNMDSIISYVKSFGQAVSENLGPRTQNLIENIKTALSNTFTEHDFDGAGAGQQHGSWFANFLETEIAGIEREIENWKNLWSNIKGSWFSFEAWWDELVSDFHGGLNNYLANSEAGFNRLTKDLKTWWDDSVLSFENGLDKYIKNSKAGFKRMTSDLKGRGSELWESGKQLGQDLWDGMTSKFWEMIEWCRTLPSQIRAAIGRISLSDIITIPTWLGGSGGSAPATEAPGVDGKRAHGGPVKRGLTYLIGEQGAETFTPTSNGFVGSNKDLRNALGGGGKSVSININNHITVKGDDGIANKIAQTIEQKLSRSLETTFSNLGYGDA